MGETRQAAGKKKTKKKKHGRWIHSGSKNRPGGIKKNNNHGVFMGVRVSLGIPVFALCFLNFCSHSLHGWLPSPATREQMFQASATQDGSLFSFLCLCTL